MRSKKVEGLIDALQPVAEEHGFEVVDAQILGTQKSPLLRIYLDTLEGGITLDQITQAQQEWLEPIVDEHDIISGNYLLEVSSPGIDRPLRTRQHFQEFAGEKVKIVSQPVDGRKKFSGTLVGMEDDCVVVEVEGESYSIPFDAVQSAHIVGNVEF